MDEQCKVMILSHNCVQCLYLVLVQKSLRTPLYKIRENVERDARSMQRRERESEGGERGLERRKRDRKAGRQTDRQTDRDTNRHTEKQADAVLGF